MYMRKIFSVVFLLLFAWQGRGQVHEFGFWGGANNVIADIGNESLIMPDGFFGSAYYRWNINPWYALRVQAGFSQWHVSDARAHSTGRRLRGWQSGGSLVDGNVMMEYEFIPLNPYKRPLRVLATPYVLAGLGAYFTNSTSGPVAVSKVVVQLPFGMGVKFSLSRKIKFNVEVLARYGWSDNLEGSFMRDTGPLPLTNRWSNDWYITQSIGFSFGYGELPCYLNVF